MKNEKNTNSIRKESSGRLGKVRIALYMILDILLLNFSVLFSLWVRSIEETRILGEYINCYYSYIPFYTVTVVVVFWFVGIYKNMWRFADVREWGMLVFANFVVAILHVVGSLLFDYFFACRLPLSCYLIAMMTACCVTIGIRVILKVLALFRLRKKHDPETFSDEEKRRLLIIGAGKAGNMLLREINSTALRNSLEIVGFIDDDKNVLGQTINGVKILGTRNDICKVAKDYGIDEIIIAIPSLSQREKADLLEVCNKTDCELKTVPGLYQLIDGEVTIQSVRKVDINDLLGREPITTELDSVMKYVRNKTIIVTGGGGSIGSELCRQLAENSPKRLIIFDIYENNAYDIQNELRSTYPELDLVVLIGSVRDSVRVNQVFETYRPDIVYHAAAHKHVPLMEDSPKEAVKNNVFGTFNVVSAADRYHVSRFVMISTDKAVNPTNIMGTTKRICEMIVQSYNAKSKTEFVAVRFGNVLGSNGSVIPLFRRQIKEGGPVTVTHPDIIRYFMTIPEAVSLVLQAGAFAKGGEIFVLDMGKPVKIVDLAENLIRLSGFKPYVDIDIQFTGLRPGEKLYEEMLMDEEGLTKTSNNRIFIGHPINFNEEELMDELNELKELAFSDDGDIKSMLNKIVPTYHMASQAEQEKVKTFEVAESSVEAQ